HLDDRAAPARAGGQGGRAPFEVLVLRLRHVRDRRVDQILSGREVVLRRAPRDARTLGDDRHGRAGPAQLAQRGDGSLQQPAPRLDAALLLGFANSGHVTTSWVGRPTGPGTGLPRARTAGTARSR